MTRTRVFYGHEGVIPPTGGIVSLEGDTPAEDEVTEIVTDDPNGEPVVIEGQPVEGGEDEELTGSATLLDGTIVTELPVVDDAAETEETPDGSWKVPAIENWAKDNGIDLGDAKTKPEKLAVIRDALNKE